MDGDPRLVLGACCRGRDLWGIPGSRLGRRHRDVSERPAVPESDRDFRVAGGIWDCQRGIWRLWVWSGGELGAVPQIGKSVGRRGLGDGGAESSVWLWSGGLLQQSGGLLWAWQRLWECRRCFPTCSTGSVLETHGHLAQWRCTKAVSVACSADWMRQAGFCTSSARPRWRSP